MIPNDPKPKSPMQQDALPPQDTVPEPEHTPPREGTQKGPREGQALRQALAVASFVVATMIVAFCLCVPPYGEIDSSALWAMAQFLIMCCTLLEVSVAFDRLWDKRSKRM